MFKIYLKAAWRMFMKNSTSSVINVSGLALGMAVAILTGLWLYDELSFNKYHENYDRIAKVSLSGTSKEGPQVSSTLSYPLAGELKTNYKDLFARLVRASSPQECILAAKDKKISSVGQYMDDPAPDMFSLKMISGSRNSLQDPHSILLAASTARALFGNADPVNQMLLINNKSNVKVTGVYEDLPLNTDLARVKFIAPFPLWVSENDWIEKWAQNDWTNHFLKLFAEIKPGSTFQTVDKQIENIEIEHIRKIDDDKYRELLSYQPKPVLEPMKDWHLHNHDRKSATAQPAQMVWMVALIGIFVLLLACINFMNISTARSSKRAREVGIRKAVGSGRRQLIWQFFAESISITALAFLFALLLATLSVDWFNQLTGKQMLIPWKQPTFWGISVAFIIVTGLIAGSYPAIFLSSFNPVKVLKGSFLQGHGSAMPRKVLVVFQFAMSITLVNCTIIVARQIMHAKERAAGYSRDGLLMVQMKSDDFYGKYDLLRHELLETGVVAGFSESMGKVTEIASGNAGFHWPGNDRAEEEQFGTLAVSPEYGKTIGWQFIQGRDFSREFASDSMAMIINESAMKVMGLKDPVGTDVTWTWWANKSQVLRYKIIGVVKDMIMESPFDNAKPIVFYQKGHNGGVSWILIKIKPGVALKPALAKIEATMKKLIPAAPFDYTFADDDYNMKFLAEERISKLAGFFATLAIVVSCLGLFGLASYMAEQRTREIGIRKVLGASVMNIWSMLSGEFVRLVFISLFIAIPVAWYFMHHWLQHYNYRTDLSTWIFLLSGSAAVLVALLTVSFQAVKASLANPVKSLQTE